jgi:hypothetical protein
MLTRLTSRYLFFSRPVLNFVNSAHARTFKNDAHREEVKNLLLKDYPNVELASLPPGTKVFAFWKGKHRGGAVPITTDPNPNKLAAFIKENNNKPEFLATSTIDTQTPSDCLQVKEDRYYIYIDNLSCFSEPDPKILEALEDIDNFNTKNKLTKSS